MVSANLTSTWCTCAWLARASVLRRVLYRVASGEDRKGTLQIEIEISPARETVIAKVAMVAGRLRIGKVLYATSHLTRPAIYL